MAWTAKDDLYMFLELCAGIAGLSQEFPIHLANRVIESETTMARIDVPLPPSGAKWLPPWESIDTFAPMFEIESIVMDKIAWQWHTTPQGKRLYTMRAGYGARSNFVVWQPLSAKIFFWDNLLRSWSEPTPLLPVNNETTALAEAVYRDRIALILAESGLFKELLGD